MIKFLIFNQRINYDENEILTHAEKPNGLVVHRFTTRPTRLEISEIVISISI